MKKSLTLLTLFISTLGFAQLPVSQLPQKKKAIVEEYNGIHCQYCPNGHRITEEVVAANPGNVFVANVHTTNLSAPSAGEPDFRTAFGSTLIAQINASGLPAVTVNRHVFAGGITAIGPNSLANAVNQIKVQDAYVNVALEADINFQTREMTVNVELYYTGNAPVSSNLLNVVVTQGNIRGIQEGVGDNPTKIDDEGNYIHEHALRTMITGQWGDTIPTVTSGTLITKTYLFTFPESFANIPVDLGELEIIAFVAESTQEIINGAAYHPTISNFVNNVDGKIEKIRVPDIACDKLVAPIIHYRNNGNNVLTSTQFEYSTNSASDVYNWTGSILPGHLEEIHLPGINYTAREINTANTTIKIVNNQTDQELSNDDGSDNFEPLANYDALIITLLLTTDQWASETSWNFKDANGNVLYASLPYIDLPSSGTTPRTFSFIVQRNRCYYFEMLDSYGDGLCAGSGNGSFQLKTGDQIIASGCQIGVKQSVYFTTKRVSFNIESDNVSEIYDTNEGDPTVHNVLTATSLPLTLKWKLIDLSVPAGWTNEVAVCDAIECHLSTVTEWEYDVTQLTGTPMDVHFINNNLIGEGHATVIVYDVADSLNSVKEIQYHLEIVQATGLSNTTNERLSVYPNPVSSILHLKGIFNENSRNASIYNSIGDEVMQFQITSGNELNTIDVSNLQDGMYLIKMFDSNRNTYRTQSFLKQ